MTIKFARPVFYFFVYSNLFIACCSVLMLYQTYHLLLGQSPGFSFMAFVFSASVCSYSFHWHLTPDIDIDSSRLRWLAKSRLAHIILFFAGLAGSAYFGLSLIKHWPWLLLAGFITFLYSAPKIPHPWFRALRKVALGKTIFLAFAWMYVTTVLPLQVSDARWTTDFYLFCGSRFFLIYSICILFDYRDREYDRSIGIRSLITWLSKTAIGYLFAFSLLVFMALTSLLLFFGYGFPAVFTLLLPGLILAGLYPYATKNFSDILYYFVLDGLMALSALLMLIASLLTTFY